ncbi:MAG TPA: hypothetical protein VM681_01245, partial [Candidatus Thermoplasmatota archaeon]|nr:hypothetical protein [Candidatus Thermoplasmatota archaeon]
MDLTPMQLAWRATGVALYLVSGAFVLLLLAGRSRRRIPLLSNAAARLDRALASFGLRHTLVLSGLLVGFLAVLHAFTLSDPHANNYGDFRVYWLGPAQTLLAGGNPYATFDGGPHAWGNGINFGLLFVAFNAFGVWAGGAYGLILLYGAVAVAVPVLAWLLAREYLDDPVLRAYVVLLSIVVPQSLFYIVRLVTDEHLTVVAVLGTLLLVKRDRIWAAAAFAGALAAVKYLPLLFLAAFLVVHYRAVAASLSGSSARARAFAAHAGALALAAAILAASLAIGFRLYGNDFLARTVGMTALLPEIEVLWLLESARAWVSPAAVSAAMLAALAALCAYVLLRPRRPDPDGRHYLSVLVGVLVLVMLLFAKVNAEYVCLAVAPAATFLALRWSQRPAAGLLDAVRSPAYVLGLSVLADATIWWA